MKTLFIVGLLFFLMGCTNAGDLRVEESHTFDTWLDNKLYVVKLNDGTRCAFIAGSFKGGISCDWKAKKQ